MTVPDPATPRAPGPLRKKGAVQGKGRRGLLGWFGIGLGVLAAVILVAVAGAYLFLQTGPGRSLLARELTAMLSTPESRIEIRDITGSVPFDMRIGAVRLADQAGEWLAADDVQLTIDAGDLLRRRATIRNLSAASLRVARLPPSKPASTPAPAGPPDLKVQLPKLPVDIDLQRLSVPVIELGAPLLGEPARLSLAAKLALVNGRADATLQLVRTDAVPGEVKLAVGYDGSHLDADLSVMEPTGTVLANALGRDDKLPLAVTLSGHGPIVGWHGRLEGFAGDAAHPAAQLQADLGLDQHGQRLAVTFDGGLSAGPLLPPDLAALVGERASLTLAAAFEGTHSRVERLRLTLAALSLDLAGDIDSASHALSATATVDVPDLAPASAIAGTKLAGAAHLSATVGGTTDRPILAADLAGRSLAYGDYRVGALTLNAKGATTGALDDKATRYNVDLTAHGEGLVDVGGAIPGDLGRSLDLRLVGESDGAGQNLLVTQLSLAGPGIAINGDGHRAGSDLGGTLSAKLEDMSRFAPLAKLPLAGSLSLDAKLGTAGTPGAAQGNIQARGSNLRIGIPVVDALLAGRVDLTTDLSRSDAGALGLRNLRLAAGNLGLSGDGSLGSLAADAPVAAKLRLEVPRLAAVGVALKSPMQGSAVLAADVSGSRDDPAVKAELTGTGLEAGGARIDRLLARLEASGIAAPQGRLDATLEGGTLPGHAAVRFSLKDRLLSLPTLDIAAGGATVNGVLEVALASNEAGGHLSAHVPDLSPFSGLAGTPLAGRVDLEAKLSRGGPRGGGQGADVTLDAAGIASGRPEQRVSIERVKLAAQLQNLLGKPTGTATLDVGKVVAGTTRVAGLTARLNTPQPGTLAFTASTSGDFGKPFRVSLGGAALLDGKRMQLRLASLDGMVANEPLKLTRPLLVTKAPDEMSIDGLSLALGAGSVIGSGSLRGQAIAGQLQARALSLGFLAGFGNVRDVSGTLSVDGSVAGTLSAPSGRLAIATRDFRMAPGNKPMLPAVSIAAEARLQPGTVLLSGRVDTPTRDTVSFAGSVPFASAGGSYTIPPGGMLSLKATGAGRLENLEDLLPLGEDRVAGPFSLAVAVGGTVAAPQASGTLAIKGGRYINQKLGTELDQIDLELDGEGRRFVIRKLTATDGAGGRLASSGAVDLGAKPSPTVDIRAKLTRFLIAHSDLATATAEGDATVGGTLAAPKVFARFTVDGGDIAIPRRLPPSVVELNVVVVDSRVKQADVPVKPEPSPPAVNAALDVAIDLPGRVFVRGDGVDSEWRGRIAVTGDSVAPVVDLRLETVRGTVSVLGKNFVIKQGLVRITPGSLDPQLDLIAEATAPNITATVHFTGTPTAPKLTLTSTPVVPQDEILSQVLFGKSVGQMNTGEGLQLAAAAASLARGGPGLLDRLRTATGLDRLELGSADTTSGSAAKSSGSGGLGNTTVSGGKYITDNVYLSVQQGASTSSTKVEVQVDVLPHLSVDSAVGANSSSSIGMKWKYDY